MAPSRPIQSWVPSLTSDGFTRPKSPWGAQPASSTRPATASHDRRHVGRRSGDCGECVIKDRAGRTGSPRETAALAAAGVVSAVRLQAVVAIGISVDADHWKDDHSRRFGRGIDITADARVTLFFRKADDFAHCSPPFRSPRTAVAGLAGSAPYLQLKRPQG